MTFLSYRINQSQKLLAYRNTLETYLSRERYNIPPTAALVSIGCGEANEAPVEITYFGQAAPGPENKIRYLGVDPDGGTLRQAAARYHAPILKGKTPVPQGISFATERAENLARVTDTRFDVAIAVHLMALKLPLKQLLTAVDKQLHHGGIFFSALWGMGGNPIENPTGNEVDALRAHIPRNWTVIDDCVWNECVAEDKYRPYGYVLVAQKR